LYLDKSLKEHTLLQAIARVNRPYDEWKTEGLIVDYYGVTKNIQKALEIFDSEDIKSAWEPDDYQLIILKSHYADMMSHLKDIDKNNLEQIIEAFEPADKRDTFEEDFKKFSKVLNSQMYKKESTEYIQDFKDLCKIRQLLRNWYENPKTSTRKYATMFCLQFHLQSFVSSYSSMLYELSNLSISSIICSSHYKFPSIVLVFSSEFSPSLVLSQNLFMLFDA